MRAARGAPKWSRGSKKSAVGKGLSDVKICAPDPCSHLPFPRNRAVFKAVVKNCEKYLPHLKWMFNFIINVSGCKGYYFWHTVIIIVLIKVACVQFAGLPEKGQFLF